MSRQTVLVDDGAYTDLFAPEQSVTVHSWEQAHKELSQNFVYTRTPIQMEQILVDAEMGVRFGGQMHRVTEKAMADLCAIVALPTELARSWPHDVAAYVLERLTKVPQKTVVPVVREDVVVAFVDPARYSSPGAISPAQYRPVPLTTVLDVSKNIWKEGHKLEIVLSDGGLVVSTVAAELQVEPKKGDVTQLGLRITGSETGGPQPVAQGYTLRLVCTNGATLTDAFGSARLSSDPRVKEHTRLERWEREVVELVPQLDLEVLAAAYAKMAGEQMLDIDWRDLYRNTSNVYKKGVLRAPRPDGEGRTPADRVLGVDREQRSAIVGAVLARERVARRDRSQPEQPPEPTPFSAYAVMNNITAAAREETPARRVALEEIAGRLVTKYQPALN